VPVYLEIQVDVLLAEHRYELLRLVRHYLSQKTGPSVEHAKGTGAIPVVTPTMFGEVTKHGLQYRETVRFQPKTRIILSAL